MQRDPIKLYWWSRQNMTNLGDELSREIVKFISGREVVKASAVEADMLAIGSVITFVNSDVHLRKSPYLVWGSGSIDTNERFRTETFLFTAVRGPLTFSLLGRHQPIPFGDPGILTSQMWPHDGSKKHRWGLVPHFRQIDQPWVRKMLAETPGSVLIDVRDPDIEASCRLIASCDFIASTSLHGLIIADSYGVPNLWLSDGEVNGSFKYWDYFAGVNRPWVKAVPMQQPGDLREYEDQLTKTRYFGILPWHMKKLAAAFPM